MQTTDPDIYAVGDCVEMLHRITGRKVLAPYGDLANLQGRVAGENAASVNCVTFPGTIQTGTCKVFDYAAGSTGLSESNAKRLGYDDLASVINASPDKPGFMEGKLLVTKLVADRKTGKILGAQCIGPGNVNRQIAHATHPPSDPFRGTNLRSLVARRGGLVAPRWSRRRRSWLCLHALDDDFRREPRADTRRQGALRVPPPPA